jgi:hypothetical protein
VSARFYKCTADQFPGMIVIPETGTRCMPKRSLHGDALWKLFLLYLEIVMKILISAVVAALASFAALAHASNIPTNAATSDSKTHVNGPRDPYTDGAKAGKFDVYSDGARVTDRREPFTDGAHS